MSAFKALNIESDDESDIEIDDTKEIQIEDALKLYQNALRLHAEGPSSFTKAASAYRDLFESDIFKYPESQTELRRNDLYESDSDGETPLIDTLDVDPVPSNSGADAGPSTLPQILHLSHKNYAQFKLEYLIYQYELFDTSLREILEDASVALDHFVQALDKDETDLDLWRKTASVGAVLSSPRIARFCLESVLDGDYDGLKALWSSPGLEEGLATEQLRDLVLRLEDFLSILQDVSSSSHPRAISQALRTRLALYDNLEERIRRLRPRPNTASAAIYEQERRIKLSMPASWADLGELLLQQASDEVQRGYMTVAPSIAFHSVELANAGANQTHPGFHHPQLQMSRSKVLDTAFVTPLAIDEIFPGLDAGKPTAQPAIAPAFHWTQSEDSCTSNGNTAAVARTSVVNLPSRKRSGDTAGLTEGNEEGRAKSKRIRARDSNIDPETTRQALLEANARWEVEQRLDELQALDDWMFKAAGKLFEKVGVIGFENGRKVREEIGSSGDGMAVINSTSHQDFDPLQSAKSELWAFLQNFSDQQAYTLTKDKNNLALMLGAHANGSAVITQDNLTTSLEEEFPVLFSQQLSTLLDRVNSGWFSSQEVLWEWLTHLLQPGHFAAQTNGYSYFRWPDRLKTGVVRALVQFDDYILEKSRADAQVLRSRCKTIHDFDNFAIMVQTIFELHLDIFTLIKRPNSGVDDLTIRNQGDRLQRWAEHAQEIVFVPSKESSRDEPFGVTALRCLWATTFHVAVSSDVAQEHVIACMDDLSHHFEDAGAPSIQLPNNAVMPELSLTALRKEKSKLMTKEFFEKYSSPELGDPVEVIHNLEPLLTYLYDTLHFPDVKDADALCPPKDASPELVQFLTSSEVSIKLMLWQRLQDAYVAIDYMPMVVSCHLRMLHLVLAELMNSMAVAEKAAKDRQIVVLGHLRSLHSMTHKLHSVMEGSISPLDCVDEKTLQQAVSTFAGILQLLQVFNIFEDSIRVGKGKPPTHPSGAIMQSWKNTATLFHDMQVRVWMILYWLLKDAIAQNKDKFDTAIEDKFEFLCAVHRNLGNRSICGAANRAFVRMLKDEFLTMTTVEHWESEQAQVLYDLYGLNCFINPAKDLTEHNCKHDAFVDKTAAIQAVDLLILQASKMPVKDLVKHSLKDSIDRVHGSISRKKPTEAILRNREIYRAFLRSPINRLDLFSCLRGQGNELPTSLVPAADAVLAAKGWYFFMGHISLTKFRSQKRTAPAPTEDVDIAIAFFMQDLEYSMDNWETWFRLAQAYDTKIEESVVWSAEKLNNSMPEMVQRQRSAIHCYVMATALANRSATVAFDTPDKMSELYYEFANRLYATSREPFNMLPFAIEENEKFLSAATGIEKTKAFPALRVFTAWKLARALFQRAARKKDHGWMLHYNTAKCLWKMHTASDKVRGHDVSPSAEQVLESIILSIEMIPKDKKDSREKREPTLEPHYKLVSIVNKMVIRGDLTVDQAKEAISHTRYAAKVTFPEGPENWFPYISAVVKNLRVADKSNWHHRIIARAAQIINDDPDPHKDPASGETDVEARARRIKHELMQQLFTKTMVLQVWRPESERAGRHFVYYAHYTRHFVKILEALKDRASLEQLARRIRRRSHDVFEHTSVWQDLCHAYLRLLRQHAEIPEGLETSTFSNVAHEDFAARKEGLEQWMQSQDSGTSAALDVLREVHEMKKINQGLTKSGAFDDLIGDVYAQLFNTVGKDILDNERRLKKGEEEEAASTKPAIAQTPPRNSMMSLNNLLTSDIHTNEQPWQVAVGTSTNPGTTSTTLAAEAPARIKNRVGRREIRLCAEACFQKVNAMQVKDSTRLQAAGTRVQVVIETSRTAAALGDSSVASSAPASIHDSADDESELSELEEVDADDEGGDEDADDGEEDDDMANRDESPGLEVIEARKTSQVTKGFETVNEPGASETDAQMMDDTDAKPNSS